MAELKESAASLRARLAIIDAVIAKLYQQRSVVASALEAAEAAMELSSSSGAEAEKKDTVVVHLDALPLHSILKGKE